jgi:hypothetical protein
MRTYEFTVYLDRVPTDEDYDRIFEAGLDDTTPEVSDGRGVLRVARRAESAADALTSVIRNVGEAGFRAVGIEDEDLVPLSTIAQRTGRTRESVRLLASGKRGPGGFPPPVAGGGWALYSWAAVSAWFAKNYGKETSVDADAEVLAAADLLLRARALTPDIGQLVQLIAA